MDGEADRPPHRYGEGEGVMDFNSLSFDEKVKFFATRRITVGKISQYRKRMFVDFFVGKIGGKIISQNGRYKFSKESDARKLAKRYKNDCKKLLTPPHLRQGDR